MFLDEARILVSSGRGGDGIVHFRREKFVPRGGPDGGRGGKGGDVVLTVDPGLNTLTFFARKSRFQAGNGGRGGPSNRTGRDGKDLFISVPPGTAVWEGDPGVLLGDLVRAGQQLIVCRGGRGGRGNSSYRTSRNRAPRMAERGEPGEERWLQLELRLLSDVGIVGLPNAGKSTLLAAVTNAQPKIADYPFTTLQPNLGVVDLDDETRLVLADIPGLIEGAHLGVGLGTAFLRHTRRSRVLIHMIDGTSADPLADFSQLNNELALFDERLAEKPQIVVINKIDLPEVEERWPAIRKRFQRKGHRPMAASALAQKGLGGVLKAAHEALQRTVEEPQEVEEVPLYRPEPEPEDFQVQRDLDGAWRVTGKAVERAAEMTYWEYSEAVRRFQQLLEHLGIERELREAGAKSGETVRIGEHELEWQD